MGPAVGQLVIECAVMAKSMNHKRRLRALEAQAPSARRNPLAVAAMMRRSTRLNKKKQADKMACRGRQ